MWDLLFTDLVLPGGMNGAEIAEKAKRIQPRIKVLVTTGYAESTVVKIGKPEPDVTLVNKPYQRAELLEKVRSILGSKSILVIEDDTELRTALTAGLEPSSPAQSGAFPRG